MLQVPFSIYLMRTSYEGVPRELQEAARIAGAGSFQCFWRVALPLTVPGMITVALFAFITSWNEFLGALVVMNKETQFTVPIMLVGVRTGHMFSVDWGALQAGIIVSIIPCLAIYLFLQKYYVSGLLSGAVKKVWPRPTTVPPPTPRAALRRSGMWHGSPRCRSAPPPRRSMPAAG
jgi:multiple sugar transport system permease protein